MNPLSSALRSGWCLAAIFTGVGALLPAANVVPPPPTKAAEKAARAPARTSLAWQIALVPHVGPGKLDEQIAKTQQAVAAAADPGPQLERLGWLFVDQARVTHDPGFYKLAENCALALQEWDKNSAEALLLRGHVAQSLHRFKEAEAIARQLVARREFALDHGLLGDALADQGKLSEAIAAYQRMVDLQPSLQSYSRVAHGRWLKGDLAGAIEAAELAAGAGRQGSAESSAWIFTRLATLQAQAGAGQKAEAAWAAAQRFVPDYAPALLLQGRIALGAGRAEEAAALLQRAVAKNPLPEYQWALADALRAAHRSSEAVAVETELARRGAANDPRTFSLYLATRGEQPDLALRLATRELGDRADVFSYDALAWAQLGAGGFTEAWQSIEHALAEGTKDARLFLHAAVIAGRLDRADAAEWLGRARALENLLLPSEREHLASAGKVPAVATAAHHFTPTAR
ncbi:MAG: tetratricopeptide repeat protein [Opitutaceae bacterium]